MQTKTDAYISPEFAANENTHAPQLPSNNESGHGFYSAVLAYKARGLQVCPVERPIIGDKDTGKAPTKKNWTDYKVTELDMQVHWDIEKPYNIGIVLGDVSKLVVLEFDKAEAFNNWKFKNPEAAANTTIIQRDNAEPGRCHVYFHLAPGQGAPKSENKSRELGWEVRSNGCQVVAPPSRHWSGGTYKVLQDKTPIQWEDRYHPEAAEREFDSGKAKCVKHDKLDSNSEDARIALGCLRNLKPSRADDYDSWLKVGMILHNSGCTVDDWISWSRQSNEFKAGVCETKWKSFGKSNNPPVTIATLLAWSRDDAQCFSEKPILVLSTTTATDNEHYVSISGCAKKVSEQFSLSLSLFSRGDAIVEIAEEKCSSGNTALVLKGVDDQGFRSRLDSHFLLMAYRMAGKGHGDSRLMANNCSADMAKALMASKEMKQGLPPITGVIRAPLLLKDGRILRKGYDRATGWFISGGEVVEGIPVETAVETLKSLVTGFDFQTPGDRSRALGSFFLPALRFGRIFTRVPLDVAEANLSQAGKTFRQDVVAAAYAEETFKMSRKDGGVGGLDESFASRLFQGRAFIQFDNIRNKLDSQYLEEYMTASGRTFGVRVPFHGEVDIDPSGSCVFLSSNGVETTPDLANRSVIVRIRKQPEGYVFPTFNGLELMEYVKANQGFVLGCIYSILLEWMRRGCPRTTESRHDFRDWCQSMDWIMREIFHESPLMDGHQEAKARVSDPNKTFLRNICIIVEKLGRCGHELRAGDIYAMAEEHDVVIPGLHTFTEDAGRKRIGVIMKAVGLKDAPTITVDGYTIMRAEQQIRRDDGGGYFQMSAYRFLPYGQSQ